MKPNALTLHVQSQHSLYSKNITIQGRMEGGNTGERAKCSNITIIVREMSADAYLGHVVRIRNHKHTRRRFFIDGHNVSKKRKEEENMFTESLKTKRHHSHEEISVAVCTIFVKAREGSRSHIQTLPRKSSDHWMPVIQSQTTHKHKWLIVTECFHFRVHISIISPPGTSDQIMPSPKSLPSDNSLRVSTLYLINAVACNRLICRHTCNIWLENVTECQASKDWLVIDLSNIVTDNYLKSSCHHLVDV